MPQGSILVSASVPEFWPWPQSYSLFHLATCCIAIVKCTVLNCYCLLSREITKVWTWLDVQVELSKFVADHDFCLEIKYEEQHQPHVITEKGDTDKGTHTPHLTALCPGLCWWAGTRKVKPIWILLKQRDSEWQWHQLGHMQVCTVSQTDNHASTSPLSFYRPDALPAAQLIASKHWRHILTKVLN